MALLVLLVVLLLVVVQLGVDAAGVAGAVVAGTANMNTLFCNGQRIGSVLFVFWSLKTPVGTMHVSLLCSCSYRVAVADARAHSSSTIMQQISKYYSIRLVGTYQSDREYAAVVIFHMSDGMLSALCEFTDFRDSAVVRIRRCTVPASYIHSCIIGTRYHITTGRNTFSFNKSLSG